MQTRPSPAPPCGRPRPVRAAKKLSGFLSEPSTALKRFGNSTDLQTKPIVGPDRSGRGFERRPEVVPTVLKTEREPTSGEGLIGRLPRTSDADVRTYVSLSDVSALFCTDVCQSTPDYGVHACSIEINKLTVENVLQQFLIATEHLGFSSLFFLPSIWTISSSLSVSLSPSIYSPFTLPFSPAHFDQFHTLSVVAYRNV